MPDELLDQLRRYGEAVERSVRRDDTAVGATPLRRRRVLLAAAAVVALVVGGAVVTQLDRDDAPTDLDVTGPDLTVPTTPTTPTTPASGVVALARGTATWVGTPDDRATLRVGACPVGNQAPNCPDLRTTSVAEDGGFVLPLPAGSGDWRVAAYVATASGCVFDCDWRGAQLGPTVQVSAADPPDDLELTVSARVVGLFVRDRDGNPFDGGGVHVNDVRCTGCTRTDMAPMFLMASARDGAVTIVVDPTLVYELVGQAVGTGWPGGTDVNGKTMWFSESLVMDGADVVEGTVLRVDGAPG